MRHFLKYYLAPLAWMGIIFFLSSQPRISLTSASSVDFIIFKSLHMAEYAFLYFLVFRALYASKKTKKRAFLYAFIISVFYAISDEIHQTFVPTREGHIRDILFDSAGAALSMTLIKKHLQSLIRLNIL